MPHVLSPHLSPLLHAPLLTLSFAALLHFLARYELSVGHGHVIQLQGFEGCLLLPVLQPPEYPSVKDKARKEVQQVMQRRLDIKRNIAADKGSWPRRTGIQIPEY